MAPLYFDVDTNLIPVDLTPKRPAYVRQPEQELTSSERLVNFIKENNLSLNSKQQKEPLEVEIMKEQAEYEKTAAEQAKVIVCSAEELKTLEASYHKAIINTVGKDAYDIYGLDALNPKKLPQDNEVAINLANKFNSNQEFRFKVSDLNNYREGFSEAAHLLSGEMAWMRKEHYDAEASKIVNDYLKNLDAKTPCTSTLVKNSDYRNYVFDDRETEEVYVNNYENNYAKEHPGASYKDFKSEVVNDYIGKVKDFVRDTANTFSKTGITKYDALDLEIAPANKLESLVKLGDKSKDKPTELKKEIEGFKSFTFDRKSTPLAKHPKEQKRDNFKAIPVNER